MTLFTAEEAAKVAGGELLVSAVLGTAAGAGEGAAGVITGVATDSRQVRPGDLFIAILGERVDGHDFVPAAAAQGASAVLVERMDPSWVLPPGVAVIRVRSAVEALGLLARDHRRRLGPKVTAVTGSVGKTTTKDLIAAVLSQRFRLLKSEGNLNTEIGLPLTLFRLTPETEAAVVEMGMRGPGQISYLASLAEPTVGVITNIGRTHLELLGSEENIARAKSELVGALPPEGVAVLNADDPWTPLAASRTQARLLYYGWQGGAVAAVGGVPGAGLAPAAGAPASVTPAAPAPQIRAEEVQALGEEGVVFRLVTPTGEAGVRLPVPGLHNVSNALAAAAVGHAWGLSAAEIAAGLAAARISDKRLNVIKAGPVTIINDTYNASPVSTRAALEVLAGLTASRRLAVLGNMLELGGYAAEGHREVGRAAAALGLDQLVAVGDLAAEITAGAREAGLPAECTHHVPDREAAVLLLSGLLRPGDAVLVKGSRGMAMEHIVAALEQLWTGLGEGSGK